MNKILDLIFEDVKNENETKKTAVTLRISALIFIGYFLCLMAVFCSMGDWMNVGGCLVCGVCYVLSFYTTYLESYERVSVDLTDTYDRVDHPVYCDVWLGLRSTALSVCISCAELYGEYCRRAEKSADCGRSMCTPSGFVCLRPEFQTVQPTGSRHKCSDTDFKYHFYFCADHRCHDHIYEGCPENGTEACTV